MKPSRRHFLKLSAAGILLTKVNSVAGNLLGSNSSQQKPHSKQKFSFGLASFSTRTYNLTQTIAITKRLGLTGLTLKSMHLPLTLSKEEMEKSVQEIKDSGLNFYGVGVLYMTTEEEVKQAFEYAKAAGVKMIIGVPEHNLLPYAEDMVKKYDINLAIHNHGPTDKRYPTPDSVYEKIKNMDKRVGLCFDIGHTVRAGVNPSESVTKCFDRLMDVHIKDESEPTEKGNTVEIGRGIIDIPAFLKTLIKLDYKGTVAFEFEKDEKDPLPGIAESVGFVHGVLSVL